MPKDQDELDKLIDQIPEQRIQSALTKMASILSDLEDEVQTIQEENTKKRDLSNLYENKFTASQIYPVGGGSVVG